VTIEGLSSYYEFCSLARDLFVKFLPDEQAPNFSSLHKPISLGRFLRKSAHFDVVDITSDNSYDELDSVSLNSSIDEVEQVQAPPSTAATGQSSSEFSRPMVTIETSRMSL
jgi:hypothetical protein